MPVPTTETRRYGLLIGVGEYPRIGDRARLLGPVHDARAVAEMLRRCFGFAARDLRLLLDADADRDGILGALDDLVERAVDGDRVVIHFSGHGSQVVSDRSNEPDGLSETWVPYDGCRTPGVETRDITDDEIYRRLLRFEQKGVFVTLNLDCCHSGHAHRSPRSRRFRGLPPVVAPERRAVRCLGHGGFRTRGRRTVLAACRDDQLAAEWAVAGVYHGAWTWSLLRALDRAVAEGETVREITVEEVFERASDLLLESDPEQWPQRIGEPDRRIFGVAVERVRPFLRAERLDGKLWRLDGGAVQGLGVGSVWGLAPSASRDGRDAWCEAELTRVEPFHGELTVRESDALGHEPPAAVSRARAFERRPSFGDGRLAVIFPPEGGPSALDELKGLVEESPWLRRGGAEAEPEDDGRTAVFVGRDLVLRDGRDVPLAGVAPGADPATLLRRLERRARARRGLELDARSDLADALEIELFRRREPDPWRVAPTRGGLVDFDEGDLLKLTLRHRHGSGLYVYVLDFGLTDRVTLIYPEHGAAEYLLPGLELSVGAEEDDALELCLPADLEAEEGIGFVKIFATTQEVDFSWITSERRLGPRRASRASGSGSLEALLSLGAAAGPFRRGSEWAAVRRGIRLRRVAAPAERRIG